MPLEQDSDDPPLLHLQVRATECDPVASWLASLTKLQQRLVALIGPLLAFLCVYLVNLAQGTLLHPGGAQLDSDLRAILLREEPTSFLTEFSLLRDYPSLLLYPMVAVWLISLFVQWTVIERFIPSAISSGVIQPKTRQSEAIAGHVADLNESIDKMRRNTTSYVLAAIGLTVLVLFAQTRVGIFGVLSPADAGAEWSRDAYRQWWGSHQNPLGFVTYYSSMFIAMYYLLKQNLIGVITVRGFRRIAKISTFHFDLTNLDGYYGWGLFRSGIQTIYLSVLTVVVAIAGLVLVVSIGQLAWLGVLILVLVFFSPIFLGAMISSVMKRLRAEKRRVVRLIEDELVGNDRSSKGRQVTDATTSITALHELVSIVRSAPTIPFRPRGLVAAVFLYAVPLASLILAIATVG